MKIGKLIYQTNKAINIFNIGDYIQSLAASQFFNDNIDYYINRENLNTYGGEEVKLIMNGWFMHEPQNWPPAGQIYPLFVAFHINKLAQNELLADDSISYFKRHEPIGCRDHRTAAMLQERGVDAYFSGCLTLTLGKTYASGEKNGKIYFADAHYEVVRSARFLITYLYNFISSFSSIITICRRKYRKINFKNIIHTLAFFSQYKSVFNEKILLEAEYIQQEIDDNFNDEEAKFIYAKKLLHKYARAKLVVTSRIHCALPCLGFETPVFYVENVNQEEVSYCRLDGLRELFNIIKYDKGNLKNMEVFDVIDQSTKVINKSDYIKFRDNLIQVCSKFAAE